MSNKLKTALVAVAAIACAPGVASAQEKIRAVASFSILGDMVARVGGDRVAVKTLVGPGGDAHVYAPTPADAAELSKAQIVFQNGLKFEGWIEKLIESTRFRANPGQDRQRALIVTEAVTMGAGAAAEHLKANVIAVGSRTGRTAMALSKQRVSVPIVAITDKPHIGRRMTLFWGVTPVETDTQTVERHEWLLRFIVEWGKREHVLQSGSRIVLIASTNWSDVGHDLMQVHMLP